MSFIGMGNLGQTAFQTLATPVQNNSVMYAAIYTYTNGNWIIQPYYRYSNVPTNPNIGVTHGASTQGGALLVSHAFKHGFSVAGRGGIYQQHGKRRGKFREPDVWSGQRGVVNHADSHVSVPALLRPMGPLVCSGARLCARCCFWSCRHESEPAQRSDGSWLYVLKG